MTQTKSTRNHQESPLHANIRNVYILLIVYILATPVVETQYSWHSKDNFDDIIERIEKVTPENCNVLDRNSLFLPDSAVSHIPDIKQLGIDPVYENRTGLLQVHNAALRRGIFFSYLLQKAVDEAEAGLMYYYLSTNADVAASVFVNASAIYFSPNRAFTPSYNGFFNKTMPLFAPRAHRSDDYNDPYSLRGTSTLNSVIENDHGAIRNDSRDSNYTTEFYKINEWYSAWLPDMTRRHDSKPTYSVQITYSDGHNETFTFHGPPSASDEPGPVRWTRPYYDCGRSNKWLVAAYTPIADLYPRHTGWRHIELPLYVAVAVVEVDYERLDINQCPLSEGNPSPNYFADTAKCVKDTTTCEPIAGFGLRRGGYQCRCKPGYRLPRHVKSPYLGEIVERSTDRERRDNFRCEKIDNLAVKTQNVQPMPRWERRKVMDRMETLTGLFGNSSSRMDAGQMSEFVRKHYTNVNCEPIRAFDPSRLTLSGSVGYGKEQQFEIQSRAALRLSHFISSFMQIVDPKEAFAEFRVPDRPLTKDQVIGETLSAMMADRSIQGLGVWFDRNQFISNSVGAVNNMSWPAPTSSAYFAPYAYRRERNARNFYVLDMALRDQSDSQHYTNNDLFHKLKTRWMANTDSLDLFTVKANIRFNSSGLGSIRFDRYPLQYKAAQLSHGQWSSPFYDCNGLHNTWLISYASPFFGWDSIKSRIEFKGIVIVNVKLADLDINQCDADYYVNNAFKDTHKCDRKSSRCIPVPGRKFDSGGYKCECLQGYEYPFNDPSTYIDGQMMEAEYSNIVQDKPSRFERLACRLAP